MLGLNVEEKRKRDGRFGAPPPRDVLVADVMTRPQPIVPAHLSMAAARKIAQLRSADALIVEDKGRLVGFLDSDSLRHAGGDRRVADCLKPLQFCLSPSITVERARSLLMQCGAGSLPVAAGPFLVGSISRSAVERSLAAVAPRASARMAA
jgi:CBS domain-containing protein